MLDRAGVNSSKVKYDYTLVFAGFSAELTAAEAERLKRTPGVANVWKNQIVHSETFTTPEFVGLDGRSGAWRKEFGSPERAGEGMIIGVIDSGFWPENPSFGALPTPRKDQKTIDAKWRGTCDVGIERPVACNNKVIGARWYATGNAHNANPGEFDSPRDYYGHGSHTASTAAGNHNVTATINGGVAGVISGMAPAARLSIYKVLYANEQAPSRPAAASTSSPRSSRPWPMVSTSSTTRSATASTTSAPSSSRSSTPPTRACSSRPRPATPGRARPPSTTACRGRPPSPPAPTTGPRPRP